jgi:hypothetical protein
MTNCNQLAALAIAIVLASCSRAAAPDNPQTAPPWRAASLERSAVPDIHFTVWSKAENRATCAPVAFASLGDGTGATPRAATFSGGWGVAYDLPDRRSAFGIAGTGVKAAEPSYDAWPFKREWADGSSVGYGPEGGGAGPKQLAYLRIAGQDCLYNVWSNLGRAHLEHLLGALRFIATP